MGRAQRVVEVVARALVGGPHGFTVKSRPHRGGTLIELVLSQAEFGRVIGRQGRTATAIRALAGLAGELDGERVQVEFLERDTHR